MAGAQPQPTISQVKQKIAALTSRQDQLVQRLDQVTQELAAARRQLAAVSRREARYRLQFRTMRSEIAQMAAYAYEYGPMTSAHPGTGGRPQAACRREPPGGPLPPAVPHHAQRDRADGRLRLRVRNDDL